VTSQEAKIPAPAPAPAAPIGAGNTPLLQVEHLHAWYGQARVLHDVNLVVQPGEAVVLLGANGAGKTTLLRAIAGHVDHRGSVQFDGREIGRSNYADIVRAGLIQVPEGRGTFADLSVVENLRLGAYPRRPRRTELAAEIDEVIELFPILAERASQAAGLLSGGEQQMLAIARALLARPRLLALDEPSLGLAPNITKDVFATLTSLRAERDLSLLIIEQNAELSLAMADRAYVIEAGVMKVEGSAASIQQDDGLRRAYLGY